MLVNSISSFSHNFFKRPICKAVKSLNCVVKSHFLVCKILKFPILSVYEYLTPYQHDKILLIVENSSKRKNEYGLKLRFALVRIENMMRKEKKIYTMLVIIIFYFVQNVLYLYHTQSRLSTTLSKKLFENNGKRRKCW